MTENCYIHIPFCKTKCKYCSFVSFPCIDKMTAYTYALLKEISENYRGERLKTFYIGGGTPSLLPVNLSEKLINKFNFAAEYEFTLEANPDDITSELADFYAKSSINRISLGVQSFDDVILKSVGRRHTAETAINAVNLLFQKGINNISIDFIYGLPTQTVEGFINDLKHAFTLPVTHISLYGLKVEEGSYYYSNIPENLPDDDIQADMYLTACDILEENGFKQYEISNFAHPGFYSRHNINYWNNNSYYGFGVSAHGYTEGFRYYNTSDLNKYISAPVQGEYAHYITDKERLEEEIFLGLRKTVGLNIADVNKKFNIDFANKYDSIIKKYSPEFLHYDGDRIALTRKGFMVSNVILSEFI